MKKKLIEQRAAVYAKMKAISDKASKEERAHLDETEAAEFDTFSKDYDDLSRQIADADTRDQETKDRVARLEMLEKEQRSVIPAKTVTKDPNIGLDNRELKEYSLLKAIRAASTNNWKDAGLEREASEEVEKKLGKPARSFYVPNDVLIEKRDLDTTTGAGAITTDLLAGSFIDMLYNRMVIRSLGATILSGLSSDIDIPKKTGKSTSFWVGEGDDLTESEALLGQVALTLKTVGGFTELTRKFMTQSSIGAENFVRMDLANTLALAMDLAATFGTGSDDQPKGIANQTGIGLVPIATDGGPVTWGTVVDLETEVSVANADVGSLAYLTNSKVRGACKKIEKVSGSGRFVWENNLLNDYKSEVSNQIPSNLVKGASGAVCSAMLFGNWADLLIGLWGGLDILVNPYIGVSGATRITAFQDCDIQVRHAESFAICKDITTA